MVTSYFKVRNLSLASTVFYHVLVLPVWYLYEVEEGDCILTSSSNDVMKYFNLAICIIYLLGQLFPLFLANVSCIWKLAKYRKEQREIGLKAVCTTHARDQDNSSLLTATQNVTSGVNSQNQQQGCQSINFVTQKSNSFSQRSFTHNWCSISNNHCKLLKMTKNSLKLVFKRK